MFHKQIKSIALLLSYVFVLGKSRVIANHSQTEIVINNVCSNISYAFDSLNLNDSQTYTYTLKFEPENRCGEAYEMLMYSYDLPNDACIINNCSASGEIQTMLNRDTLEQVCMGEAPEYVRYEEQLVDLCNRKSCHLECVKNFDNVCDNITEVEEVLELENINEDQKYAVVFNKAKGEKHCSRTAKRLKRLPEKLMDKNVDGTVHTESCMEAEKFISATLNLNGLKWACNRKQLMKVQFEEKYFNESVCQNITRAKQLFFPDDNNPLDFKQFKVSYLTSDATVDCKNGTNRIDDIRQGSGQRQKYICAIVIAEKCDVTPANFNVAMNYEGLKFVCDSTDFRKGTVGTIHVSKVEEINIEIGLVC